MNTETDFVIYLNDTTIKINSASHLIKTGNSIFLEIPYFEEPLNNISISPTGNITEKQANSIKQWWDAYKEKKRSVVELYKIKWNRDCIWVDKYDDQTYLETVYVVSYNSLFIVDANITHEGILTHEQFIKFKKSYEEHPERWACIWYAKDLHNEWKIRCNINISEESNGWKYNGAENNSYIKKMKKFKEIEPL